MHFNGPLCDDYMRGGILNGVLGPKLSVMRKCDKGSKFRSLTLRLMKNCSGLIPTKKDYLHAEIARLYPSLLSSLSSFGCPVSHIGSCCHVRSRGTYLLLRVVLTLNLFSSVVTAASHATPHDAKHISG